MSCWEYIVIKNYLELTQTELSEFLDFINRNKAQKTTLEQFRQNYVNENHSDPEMAIDALVTHEITTARVQGALNIYIGVREEHIKTIFDELNYKRSYQSLVQAENQNIVMFEIEMEDSEDTLAIGLKRDWQNKVYGKRLLETAIDLLNQKEAPEIFLIVMSKNKRAYEMYLKRGFVVKKVLTDWYVRKEL